jgi:hypothetical protein
MAEPMVRTQIYLTEREQDSLADLSARTGRSKSDLIRQALDEYLDRHPPEARQAALRGAFGLWRERRDLPDFPALRRELDRAG